MENLKNTIALKDIAWPVFRLKELKPEKEDGRIFYRSEFLDHDDVGIRTNIRIVDDKNVSGKNLGMRRLRLAVDEVPLFPIHRAIYFLGDLLKQAKPTTWFVDSNGSLFQFTKSSRAKLTCHKIKNLFPTDGIGVVVEVQGISSRFKTIYRPSPLEIYAGILTVGMTHIFYGFYEEPFPQSWRRV